MPPTEPPADPVDRLRWIKGRRSALLRLEQKALFNARLQGRLDEAIEVSGRSRKRVIAMTRAENEATGRMVRWNSVDG